MQERSIGDGVGITTAPAKPSPAISSGFISPRPKTITNGTPLMVIGVQPIHRSKLVKNSKPLGKGDKS